MKTLRFNLDAKPTVGLLIKEYAMKPADLTTHYVTPLSKHTGKPMGLEIGAIGLWHPIKGKIKKAELKEKCNEILNFADTKGIHTLLVADSEYFKYLTGLSTLEKHIGEVHQCSIAGWEHIKVLPAINYTILPMSRDKLPLHNTAIETLGDSFIGKYSANKEFTFSTYEKVTDIERLKYWLDTIKDKDALTFDIESTGLYVGVAEVLTLGIGWSEHDAITIMTHDHYGVDTTSIITMLKEFITTYPGRMIFHNGMFDVKHLVYRWWMKDFNDTVGMLEGIDAFNLYDTRIAAYISLNSTARAALDLKSLSYPLLGDYAEDVSEAINIPPDDLSVYCAKDVCGTFYVYNKYKEAFETDIFRNIFKPSVKPLLQMMLNGMPMDMVEVRNAEVSIQGVYDEAIQKLRSHEKVKLAERQMRYNAMEKYNASHKKQKTFDDIEPIEFNPNSPTQLQLLLFDIIGLEPIEQTKSGAPSTGRDTLEELRDTADADIKPLLESLIAVSETSTVLSSFVLKFYDLAVEQGGEYTLHGSLNLGGTISGRLSSSDPNMQNLPSGSEYGKYIKRCFQAPQGWVMAGADFNALEARIGAILSKDVTMRNIIMNGFDQHCVNATAFLPEDTAEFDPLDKDSVNSIKKLLPDVRQAAKAPGFA